ncbi:MAG: phage virion morphogenesis protein, partial [Pseudomonas sp.]
GPGTLRESLHLQSSIRYQVEGEAVRIGTDVPYAAAHQFGTPARVIRPRHGKALSWPGAGHPVKQVNHPGLLARPFLGLSSEDESDILAMLADYLGGG